ncbi:caspase family protein [Chitinophaga sp. S165]|uniref:caspase family protein n=1 Tax=Chitinophaga sp. S165 TaxID=2135462 RepID=UPI000D711D28|nr:caspase family protein [Chitinophaga sp. S165]PWV56007.1 caspase domain-containing protein [Chitinophaga sp. S165]
MSSIYALLVGINQYHPDTDINPLSGCENDVKRFEEYLGQLFPEEKRTIKTLSGHQATRDEVIGQFKEVLIDASIQPGDIALFYFSGHGSYARSNPAFDEFDVLGLDETLVLYDSRCDGNYDLADKELALLLHKIPQGADIVCIIDSCHSGSITREFEPENAQKLPVPGSAKQTPSRDDEEYRELSAYLSPDEDLSYAKMAAEGRLLIPSTRHIVLSACARGEVAYESTTAPTAIFTNALLTVLKEGQPSYASLFEYVQALLQRQSEPQTPQLRVYEGYNPDKIFLGQGIQEGQPLYQVQRRKGKWAINAGAIHGLKNDKASMQATTINIYRDKADTVRCTLATVGLDTSELSGVQLTPGLYPAGISNLLPIIDVLVEAPANEVSQWMRIAEKGSRQGKIRSITGKDIGYDYKVAFEDDAIVLKDHSGNLVHGARPVNEETIGYMYDCCRQIAQWKLLLQLQNQAMKEHDFKIDFSVDVQVDPEKDVWRSITDSDTLILADGQQLLRSIRLENNSDVEYYAAVYSLYSNYGIKRRTEDVDASLLIKGVPIPALAKRARLFIADYLVEDTLRLKLIISKQPFKDFFIREYEGLEQEIVNLEHNPANRAALMGIDDDTIDLDWYAKTITIRLVRSKGKILPPELSADPSTEKLF